MPRNFILAVLILPGLALAPETFAKDRYPRDSTADILHYAFHLSLNDTTVRIEGKAVITALWNGRGGSLALDLKSAGETGKGMAVTAISSMGMPVDYRHAGDRLLISLPATENGPKKIDVTITYAGIPADGLVISKNRFGERTFFGDNWPDRARNWLPCVDHPYDKATVEFIVTAPEGYGVVSNGYLAGEYPAQDGHGKRVKVTHWKEDVPLPTKVMVIGVADFAWETAGHSKGIPVQSWVFAKDREPGFTDYGPATGILTFYQEMIGPYSFGKLANVQSKTMFGGMENSGCIFYNERSVNGKNNQQGLLAHEIAHQWFGDAVTEGDWHHIWLSEGFATYLEAIYADSMLPGRKLQRSMADMRNDVIRYYDRTHKPVIDSTITDNMQLLSTNSYQKGAWVLHMLRHELGDSLFFTSIREFYAERRDRNALTDDLIRVVNRVSGKQMNSFFNQWLTVAGQPDISWTWVYNRRKKTISIDMEQTQEQHCFDFAIGIEMDGGAPESVDSHDMLKKQIKARFTGRQLHLELPVDFKVTDVRLDPGVELLFRENNPTKKALPDGISG